MWLWVRIGDAGDYNRHDDLESAAESLAEMGIRPPLSWCSGNRAGFECGGYRGNNYISVYWGDAGANLLAVLVPGEREDLERHLERPDRGDESE